MSSKILSKLDFFDGLKLLNYLWQNITLLASYSLWFQFESESVTWKTSDLSKMEHVHQTQLMFLDWVGFFERASKKLPSTRSSHREEEESESPKTQRSKEGSHNKTFYYRLQERRGPLQELTTSTTTTKRPLITTTWRHNCSGKRKAHYYCRQKEKAPSLTVLPCSLQFDYSATRAGTEYFVTFNATILAKSIGWLSLLGWKCVKLARA